MDTAQHDGNVLAIVRLVQPFSAVVNHRTVDLHREDGEKLRRQRRFRRHRCSCSGWISLPAPDVDDHLGWHSVAERHGRLALNSHAIWYGNTEGIRFLHVRLPTCRYREDVSPASPGDRFFEWYPALRCFTKRLVYTYRASGKETICHCKRPPGIRFPKRNMRVPAGMARNGICLS